MGCHSAGDDSLKVLEPVGQKRGRRSKLKEENCVNRSTDE